MKELARAALALRHREKETFKRRILSLDRFGMDRRQQILLLYRLADRYGRQVYPRSFCHTLFNSGSGCTTGECCQCRPDVFAHEKEVLDRLPHRDENRGYCPFFDHASKKCSIYAHRPLGCRLYFNVSPSRLSCTNPGEEVVMLLDNLKRHVERVLEPYLGGYAPRGL